MGWVLNGKPFQTRTLFKYLILNNLSRTQVGVLEYEYETYLNQSFD